MNNKFVSPFLTYIFLNYSPSRGNVKPKVKVRVQKSLDEQGVVRKRWIRIQNYVSNHISEIFITVLYTLVLFAIFAEKAYCMYSQSSFCHLYFSSGVDS